MSATAALPLGDGQAALTIASEHRDFADWHRGRRQYALWAIDMRFDGAIVAMRKHLAAYLLPGYARQAHITLSVCGFPGTTPARTTTSTGFLAGRRPG